MQILTSTNFQINYDNLLKLAAYVYRKDNQGHYLHGNECTVAVAGFTSLEDLAGQTDNDLWWRDSAEIYQYHDGLVAEQRRAIITVEPLGDKHNVSIKIPYLSDDNQLHGIIGINFEHGEVDMIEIMNIIKPHRLPIISKIQQKLAPREAECLGYIIKGYYAKQIAEFMNISPRTVEAHTDNLKRKLGCHSKAELIRVFQ